VKIPQKSEAKNILKIVIDCPVNFTGIRCVFAEEIQ